MNNLIYIIILVVASTWGDYTFEQRQYPLSSMFYRTAAEIEPDDRSLNMRLARSYAYGGQKHRAVKVLNQRIREKPEDIDALLLRGIVHSWLKNWKVAVNDLTSVVNRKQTYTGAWKALLNVYEWSDQFDKAILVMNRIIELEPEDSKHYLSRARLHLESGNQTEARRDLLKARSRGEYASEYSKLRDRILSVSDDELYQVALGKRTEKDYHKALVLFDRILDREPENVTVIREKARTLAWMKRYEEAIEELELALKIDPDDLQAGKLLIQVLKWNDSDAEALKRCEEFLDQSPHHDFMALKISLLISGNRLEQARKAYIRYHGSFSKEQKNRLSALLESGKRQRLFILAEEHRDRKEYGKAITFYTRVLEVDPENLRARRERARTFSWMKKYSEFHRDVDQCLKEAPGDKDLWNMKIRVLVWQDRHEQAISLLDGLIQENPEEGYWNLKKSSVLADIGKRDESYRSFLSGSVNSNDREEVKRLRLKLARSRLDTLLDRARAEKGKHYRAYRIYTEVLKADPGNRTALRERGRILSWKKKYKEAENDLMKCLKLHPDDSAAAEILVNLYRWQGKNDKALELVQKQIEQNPEDGNLYIKRGKILAGMENYPGAHRDLRLGRKYEADSEKAYSFEQSLKKNPEAYLWELKQSFRLRTFDPERTSWKTGVTSLKRKFRKGTAILEWWHPRRFGRTDHALALDTYFDLWERAYGNFRTQFTEDPEFLPASDNYIEIFQGFGKGWEVSGYYKTMRFSDVTRIYGGSLGKYIGPWFLRYRPMWTSSGSHSWSLLARYYYGTADDFIEAEYGQGKSPLEILTREDLLPQQKKSWRVRLEKFITPQWGFYIQHSRRDETGGIRPFDQFVNSGGVSRRW